ncbi:MAG: FKBP-type peptidyl-prolyl cis-trans isomerase [Bacteroidetes bacterium]|nr:FKBP-type peptidyl-prolyl cis-trans isomerase [Bacteroidota bacterium]
MKNFIISLTVVVIIATVIFSCSNNKFNGFNIADNGTYYKIHFRGADTSKAAESEIVTVNLAYRLGDSVLFNSNSLGEPMMFPVIKPMFKGDLYAALTLMGTGDSVTVAVVADSFYLKTANLPELPEFVVPGSHLYYDIKLIKHISNSAFQTEMNEIRKEQERQEKILLQNYLVNNNITTKPTASGLYFIPIEKGRGSKPDTGNMCQIFLSVKQLDGTELYTNFGDMPLDVEYGSSFDTKGFMEGLGRLKTGGKAQLIVPSWIGVGSTGKEVVAPFTTLIYEVKLEAIRSLEEVRKDRERYKKEQEIENLRLQKEEPVTISNYLKKNNIDIEPTESGLYFKEIVAGSGNHPVDGNTVTLEYLHYDLVGNLLQSSYDDKTPFTYVVGTGAVIAGWEEAVKLMRKGGKAWMLIPSDIGYSGDQRTKEIKPFTPLVFELEVTDIGK